MKVKFTVSGNVMPSFSKEGYTWKCHIKEDQTTRAYAFDCSEAVICFYEYIRDHIDSGCKAAMKERLTKYFNEEFVWTHPLFEYKPNSDITAADTDKVCKDLKTHLASIYGKCVSEDNNQEAQNDSKNQIE